MKLPDIPRSALRVAHTMVRRAEPLLTDMPERIEDGDWKAVIDLGMVVVELQQAHQMAFNGFCAAVALIGDPMQEP